MIQYTFAVILEWLDTNVGMQGVDWDYVRGDLHAYGILFLEEQDATAFKLRFEV